MRSQVPVPPVARPAVVGLQLFNGFRVSSPVPPAALPTTCQRLLALLALRRRLDRSVAAGTLWPDVSEDRALGSLRSAMWRANRVLTGLVQSCDNQVALQQDVAVDVDQLLAQARRLRDGAPDAASRPDELALGDLLPGWDEDWVLLERERLRQVQLYALCDLAVSQARRGATGAAVDTVHHALRLEPLRESTHRLLIQLHIDAGDYAEALHRYDCYRTLAREELGVVPSPRMTALLGRVPRAAALTRPTTSTAP